MIDLLAAVTQNVCLIVSHWKLMLDTSFFPGYICSVKDTLYLFANILSTLGQRENKYAKNLIKIHRLLSTIPQPFSTGSSTELEDACHMHALINSTIFSKLFFRLTFFTTVAEQMFRV